MSILIVILIIFFISLLGYLVIWSFRLNNSQSKLTSMACSYGLGVGLVTMQLFIYSRLQISWQKELILTPWIILIAVLILTNIKRIKIKLPKIPKLGKLDYFFLAGILLTICYVIFEALLRPPTAWDAWVIWLFKAKIFFVDGAVLPSAFEYEQSGYPVIINLLATFIYLMLGYIDDTAVLLTSTAFYLAIAVLIFSALKDRFGTKYALLFTFLFVTTQNMIRHGGRIEAGQADLPLAYFALASLLLLFNYLHSSNRNILFLLSFFLGILGLIKYEGIPLGILIAGFILIHIYKKKLFSHLFPLLLWIIPILDWQLYRKIYDSPQNDYFTIHKFVLSINKIWESILGTLKEFITIKTWNMLWIVYFCLPLIKMKFNKEFLLTNILLLFQLSIYMFMYMFTTANNPESSIQRLLIHLAPLALFAIALGLGRSSFMPKSILPRKGD